MDHVKGPDFPTGGVLVDGEDTIARAYVDRPRRVPASRARSTSSARRAAAGTAGQRNPVPGAKAKLIEQIAQLIADKKLPILADVRDECDAQIRIVIEPRAAPSIPSC